jgi:D-beta-D-heptose 7-phosphate kinase/D-beta-D-heptose 1-phosphate adenosyltransferase
VGDLILDLHWHGKAATNLPEESMSVVRIERPELRVGGAAMMAANLAAMGVSAHLMGLVGEDEHAEQLIQAFSVLGLGQTLVAATGARTITKLQVIADKQQVMQLDFEPGFTAAHLGTLAERFLQKIQGVEVVLFSDHGKGTLVGMGSLISAARAAGKWVVVATRAEDFSRCRGASIVMLELSEFEGLMGPCGSSDNLAALARELAAKYDLQAVIVTRGDKGMSLVPIQGADLHLPSTGHKFWNLSGAGEALVAALGCAFGTGCSIEQAVEFANAAACVKLPYAGSLTQGRNKLNAAADLLTGVPSTQPSNTPKRRCLPLQATIGNAADLLVWRAAARARGERVVMTNGCFDLLHPGHLDYLARARALGDRLVVAVNDDASVQRLKGASRPVNPLSVRKKMLAGLAAVDYVVSFAQDTPESLYAQVVPDVLVKGGDYRAEDIAGAGAVRAAGGKVIILPFVEGHSSTSLIERIQTLHKA